MEEKSICINCENFTNCNYVSGNKIIWDCNEYVIATDNDKSGYHLTSKSKKEHTLELI